MARRFPQLAGKRYNPTMALTAQEIALGLGMSVAVGALVGVERERRSKLDGKASFGGIRTFPLIGLIGGLGGLMSQAFGPLALFVPFVAVLALLLAACPLSRACRWAFMSV